MRSRTILFFLLSQCGASHANQLATESVEQAVCPIDERSETANYHDDRMAIEQMMRVWKNAVQQEDLATIGSLVTIDAEFWTQETEPLVGRNALVAAFKPFLAEYTVLQDYHCQELVIAEGWAFIRGLEENTLTNKVSGESRISKQRAFSVLQKDGQGQWRFARGMTHRPPKD